MHKIISALIIIIIIIIIISVIILSRQCMKYLKELLNLCNCNISGNVGASET